MTQEQKETILSYNASVLQYQNTIAQLKNYDHCYDFLSSKLQDGDRILDLACGPANISQYLLKNKQLNITGYDLSEAMLEAARKNIPGASFYQKSIISFEAKVKFDVVLNGFGIPYLTWCQVEQSIKSSYNALKSSGFFFLSFMEGDSCGFENPSFNKNVKFYIYYHSKKKIAEILKSLGLKIIKEWELDYQEPDGSITTDVVIISQKC